VPADTSQYAQNRVSGDRISQKITDPDPEEERLPNVFIPVLATLTLILIAALRLIFIRRKTARHPDFALARCARLISSRQDFSPDSSGRYPADSLSDRTVADEFRLLQSECERLYYSQNANKVGKYTFGDVAAKCVRLSRGYACGGKNVFGKIRVYLVDFFCG
jgi:hypothetical protein